MTTTARLTLEEFLALPETEPASEFIDGEVVQKAMPTFGHGVIQRLLGFVFTLYLREHPGGDAGSEIRCLFGPVGGVRTWVPDFIFVSAARLGAATLLGPLRAAPDFAVEILSPDDRMGAVREKIRFYLAHGVRLVWLIDPERRTVLVFTPDAPDTPLLRVDTDTLDGGDVLLGFATPVADILPSVEQTPAALAQASDGPTEAAP